MTLQQEQRIAWIDCAKCLAIFLVVLGHTLRGGMVQHFIYSFQTTAFFFLSGMTCKAEWSFHRIKTDFLRIMVPYYSFGILSIMIFSVLGEFVADRLSMNVNTSLISNLWELIITCPQDGRLKFNVALWFLPCLFATKTIYYGLYFWCKKKHTVILACCFVLTVLGFVYSRLCRTGLPFHLPVALKMLTFFSLGRVCFLWYQNHTDLFLHRCRNVLVGSVLLFFTAVVANMAPKINYTSDYFPSFPAFLLAATSGSMGICLIAMGIDNHCMSFIGKSSLAILVMHKFPILIFQTIGPQKKLLERYDTIPCLLVAILIAALSIAMCLAAQRIIMRFSPFFLGCFTNPIRLKNSSKVE